MEVLARYKRKAVPNPLEIRGISQNAVESLIRTSPDELPALVLPRDFTDRVEEAMSMYSPEPVSNVRVRAALHTQPSVVPEETHSLSLSDTWTTGGAGGGSATERLTDDRSSTCTTMSYDDFDYEASMKVRRMFEEIDSTLFESVNADVSSANSSSSSSSSVDNGEIVSGPLQAECRQWNAVFPHLRILGKQLIDAKDPGYQTVSLPSFLSGSSLSANGGSTVSHLEDVTELDLRDSQSLSVDGRRVVPRTLDKCCPPGVSLDSLRHLEEEILEQDGCYEEMIAVDREALDDAMDSRNIRRRHRRSRYPPVTPNACAKDNVCDDVFDVIWENINVVLRPFLQQWVDNRRMSNARRRDRHGGDDDGVAGTHRGKPSGGTSVNDAAFRFPQIVSQPPSRADFMPVGGGGSSSRPLGSLFAATGTAVSRHLHTTSVGGGSGAAPGTGSHTASTAAAAETIKLDTILTISKKEMQAREKTFSEEPSNAGTPTASMSWPGGSLLKKATASVLVNGLHRNMSATTKKLPAGRGRLAPLNDRVRTPTVEDEAPMMLRPGAAHVGYQGLHMAGRRISSPPTVAASSGSRMLPPIVHSEQFEQFAAAASLSQKVASQQQQKKSSRATSAVADKEGRVPRDKLANVPQPETRPSTTHTAAFLVDSSNVGAMIASNRQVTTPLGSVAPHFRGEGTGLFLGITGSSLTAAGGSSRDAHAVVTASDGGLLSPLSLAEQLRQRTATAFGDPDLDDDDIEDEHYDDFSRQHYHPPLHQQHWGTASHASSGYTATGYRHRGGKPVSSLAR